MAQDVLFHLGDVAGPDLVSLVDDTRGANYLEYKVGRTTPTSS